MLEEKDKELLITLLRVVDNVYAYDVDTKEYYEIDNISLGCETHTDKRSIYLDMHKKK